MRDFAVVFASLVANQCQNDSGPIIRLVKWLVLTCAFVWYLWRVYTLSYSPHEFPDPVFANKVWDKRSNYNCCLGAAIAAAALYWTGIIHSWWVVLLVFLVSILLVGLVQIGLVALIIFGRTAKIMFRVKLGLSPGSPWLAPFVWGYYLTPEEKRSALGKK
jgi:hypothetical protein